MVNPCSVPRLEMEQDLEAVACDCPGGQCAGLHTRPREGSVDRFFVDGRRVSREEFVAAGGDPTGIPHRVPGR